MSKRSFNQAALVTAYGGPIPNRAAIDFANNIPGVVCRYLMDKVSAALKSAHVGFRAPPRWQVFGWMTPREPH